MVELIDEEEVEILAHRRLQLHGLLYGVALLVDVDSSVDRLAAESYPVGIGLLVGGVRAVDAREEHVELGSHLVALLMPGHDVGVGLVGVLLHLLGVEGGALLSHGIGLLARNLINRRGVERGAVEQRTVAVLLAVEVRCEGEKVVGRVLVHRRVGRGAYEQQCIGAVADENHQGGYGHKVQYSHRKLPAHEEPCGKTCGQQHGEPETVADEEHSG